MAVTVNVETLDIGRSAPMPLLRCAVMRGDGTRLYAGRQASSNALGLDALVLKLSGGTLLDSHSLRACSDPVLAGTTLAVGAIALNAAGTRLYLATLLSAGAHNDALIVYTLDGSGDVTGDPRPYDVGIPSNNGAQALAVNPAHPVLYVGGGDTPSHVSYYALDGSGEPTGSVQAFDFDGAYQPRAFAVNATGTVLYYAAFSGAGGAVWTIALDGSGHPTGTPATHEIGGITDTLHWTPGALFVRQFDGARFGVVPLDGSDLPTGPAVWFSISPDADASYLMGADPATSTAYALAATTTSDVFSFASIQDGVALAALHADGTSSVGTRLARRRGIGVVGAGPLVLHSDQQGARINRRKGESVRVTITGVTIGGVSNPGGFTQDVQVLADVNAQDNFTFSALAIGTPSAWHSLDVGLKNLVFSCFLIILPGYADLDTATLLVEIKDAGNNIIASITQTMAGTFQMIYAPGYAADGGAGEDVTYSTPLAAHAAQDAASQACAAAFFPALYNVACSDIFTGQRDETTLDLQLAINQRLGMNVCEVKGLSWYQGGMHADRLDALLTARGFVKRKRSTGNPPTPWGWQVVPADFTSWAAIELSNVTRNGCSPSQLAFMAVRDEPGFPVAFLADTFNSDSAALTAFVAYLTGKGFVPGDFGLSVWGDLRFAKKADTGTLNGKKRFYWSVRFFTDQFGYVIPAQVTALDTAFGLPVRAWNDLNNYYSSWYAAGAGGSDGVMGYDWFQTARLNFGQHTEDWTEDRSSDFWCWNGDLSRCLVAEGARGWGGYVIPQSDGRANSTYGLAQSVLSMAARGASWMDYWLFGPNWIGGNGWSNNVERYPGIANANSLLAQSEGILHPAEMTRGNVAILVPGGGSDLWQPNQDPPLYRYEARRIHRLLCHAGYAPIDVVDETDVTGGALTARGYSVLYVTAPNVPVAVQAALVTWVAAGGTLVLTPGACSADEYDTLTTTLDGPSGVSGRSPVRDTVGTEFGQELGQADVVTFSDATYGTGTLSAHGPLRAPTVGDATVKAAFTSGAAITEHASGSGRVIVYGFFPGLRYTLSADWNRRNKVGRDWDAAARLAGAAPCVIAGTTTQSTTNTPAVEVLVSRQPAGLGVTLLNWTGDDLGSVSVTIPSASSFQTVNTLFHGSRTPSVSGSDVTVTLPLGDLDVLLMTAGGGGGGGGYHGHDMPASMWHRRHPIKTARSL